MYFNWDIRPVDCNINLTTTCISIRTLDRSTAILIQQVHVFQFRHSTGRLNINSTSTCISIQTFDWSTQY